MFLIPILLTVTLQSVLALKIPSKAPNLNPLPWQKRSSVGTYAGKADAPGDSQVPPHCCAKLALFFMDPESIIVGYATTMGKHVECLPLGSSSTCDIPHI